MQTPLFSFNGKVYINHTDAGGIVYHANYLTFFENCRREWLTTFGMDAYFIKNELGQAIHFVVKKADIDYVTPLLLDDKFLVTIDEIIAKPASLFLTQRLYKVLDNEFILSAKADFLLPCVCHHQGKLLPTKLPQNIILPLNNILNQSPTG